MKKIIMAGFLFLAASNLKAQSIFDKEPYLTQSLSTENINFAEVKTSGGSIVVKGIDAAEARIEMYVSPNGGIGISKEELKSRLEENYEINIRVSNGRLTAIAKQKNSANWNWKKSLGISFKVYVPQNLSSDLNTSGGSITLSNLNGNQDFSTSGGSLHIDHITGKIDGQTSGGSIHVADSKSDIDLNTSGGSIEAENCTGKIKLSTSGGSLHLSNLDGTINAQTSGGSVDGDNIKGELITGTSGGSVRLNDLYCSLDASTSGGSIHVEIKQLGKYITLKNSAGNIDLEMPKGQGIDIDLKANKIKYNQLNNFTGGSATDKHVTGSLNGGGIPVKLNASSGTINLTFN